MTEQTELDRAFIDMMTKIAAGKAELHRRAANPKPNPELDALLFAGFRQVRKARRVAIARYRSLKDLEKFQPE